MCAVGAVVCAVGAVVLSELGSSGARSGQMMSSFLEETTVAFCSKPRGRSGEFTEQV